MMNYQACGRCDGSGIEPRDSATPARDDPFSWEECSVCEGRSYVPSPHEDGPGNTIPASERESQGHVFWFLTAVSGWYDIIIGLDKDIYWAPASCVLDVTTGYRCGMRTAPVVLAALAVEVLNAR